MRRWLIAAALAAACAAPAVAWGAAPAPPEAGRLPDPVDCLPSGGAAPGAPPEVESYCRLRALCEAHAQDPNAVEDRDALAATCPNLRQRELLRSCQTAGNTRAACVEQHRRLKYQCAAIRADDKDRALCWEYQHPLPVGADPQVPGGDPAEDPAADTDVLGTGNFRSPICKRSGLDPETARNCKASGTVESPEAKWNYGIDSWVGNKAADPMAYVTHEIVEDFWALIAYALRTVLLLLDWAFSIDLLNQAMPDLESALLTLQENVLGERWVLACIGMAGLWGIWNGLIRARTIETFAGLTAAVLLMSGALVIIHDPRGTVGEASRWASDSSVDILAIASRADGASPGATLATSHRDLFHTLIAEPWCALQFGSVEACSLNATDTLGDGWCGTPDIRQADPSHDGRPSAGVPAAPPTECPSTTLAAAWLQKPPGGGERKRLYERLKAKHPQLVESQEAPGSTSRVVLVLLVFAGLLGAALMLLFLAVQLILVSVKGIALLLVTPFMLFAAALGDRGREAVLGHFMRMGGVAVGEVFFTLWFAGNVLGAGIITQLHGLGWYTQWIVLAAFFWGQYGNRYAVLGVLTFDKRGGSPTMMRAAAVYGAFRMLKDTGGMVWRGGRAATRVTSRPLAAGGRHWLGRHRRSQAAEDSALQADAGRQLEAAGMRLRGERVRAERGEAARILAGPRPDAKGIQQAHDRVDLARQNLRQRERDQEAERQRLARAQAAKRQQLARLRAKRASLDAQQAAEPDPAKRMAIVHQRGLVDRDIAREQASLRTIDNDLARELAGKGVIGADVARLSAHLTSVEAARDQMLERDREVSWARGVQGRYGNLPDSEVRISGGDVRDELATQRARLAAQDPAHDSRDDAELRTLLARAERPALGWSEREDRIGELDPAALEAFRRDTDNARDALAADARRRRRGLFR